MSEFNSPQSVRVRLRRYQRSIPSTPVMMMERTMDITTGTGHVLNTDWVVF